MIPSSYDRAWGRSIPKWRRVQRGCDRAGRRGLVSPAWLAGCYLLLSMAEVLLGPLGLSLLTQIAPPQKTSQAVGLWFAATGVGNVLTGLAGLIWECWPHHLYFMLLALLSIGAAALLWMRLSQLEAATRRGR